MFVINGVVFRVLKKIHEIGHHKSDECLGMRNRLQPRQQIFQVVNMRKDVPAQNQIRRAPIRP